MLIIFGAAIIYPRLHGIAALILAILVFIYGISALINTCKKEKE